MARRDVDVVIGARTDRSAFAKTEQETKGFLGRLRGATGGRDPLQATSMASERLAKAVQAAALVEASARTIDASFNLVAGISQRIRGDMEASAESIEKAYQTMRTAPVIGSVTGAIESVMSMTTHRNMVKETAELNAEILEMQQWQTQEIARQNKILAERASARQRLANMIRETDREERLAGLEGYDLQIALIKERMRARKDELLLIRDTLKTVKEEQRINREWIRYRDLALEEIAALEKKRAKEAADEWRKNFFSLFKSVPQVLGVSVEAPPEAPFRASLPSLLTGNLLTGAAAQSEQGASLANRQVKAAEETNVKLDRQTSILSQILQATRGQTLAPVLQNF